jgi:colanic acid biosynthesis glycosyl transferase WcaI
MHILLVTTYFEPDSGAAAVRLSRLAHMLRARGHDVTVLTTLPHYPQGRINDGYRGRFAVVEDREGLRVIRTWLFATSSTRISRRLISQNSYMVTAFLRGLGIRRPDVILIEAQPVFTSLAAVMLSVFKRVPYVLNVSDLWPDHLLSVGVLSADHPIYRAARWLVDRTYHRAAHIIAMSPAWAQKIEAYIGNQGHKVSVVYNSVDLMRFSPQVDATDFKQKYSVDPSKKVVSFISTFTTPYDFDLMLEVAARLGQRDDVQVLYIGGGSQADVLEARLAQGDLPHVRWLGWIDYAEIPAAWAASDVTYLALRDHALYTGTIPAKYYEVMASGVPIANAINGVAAQMIERSGAGIAVPCGDVDGLSEALHRLLDDDALRQQCAEKGREYAETHFAPDGVVDAYERRLLDAAKSR